MEVIRTYRIVEAALMIVMEGSQPSKQERAPPAETAEGSERSTERVPQFETCSSRGVKLEPASGRLRVFPITRAVSSLPFPERERVNIGASARAQPRPRQCQSQDGKSIVALNSSFS